jgi:hypothetical protein
MTPVEYMWIILIVQALVCGYLSAEVAALKGYSGGSWFVRGFLFGILGLIAAAGIPQKCPEEEPANTFTKKCPDCSELIVTEARVCKFCRCEFSEDQLVTDLIAALGSPSISVCSKAVRMLVSRQEVTSIPKLLQVIEDAGKVSQFENDDHDRLQDQVVRALIEWRESSITKQVVVRLHDCENLKIMKMWIYMLGELRDISTVKTLVDLLHDINLHTSLAATLVKFGQVSIPHLEEALKSSERSERKIAERIVKKING